MDLSSTRKDISIFAYIYIFVHKNCWLYYMYFEQGVKDIASRAKRPKYIFAILLWFPCLFCFAAVGYPLILTDLMAVVCCLFWSFIFFTSSGWHVFKLSNSYKVTIALFEVGRLGRGGQGAGGGGSLLWKFAARKLRRIVSLDQRRLGLKEHRLVCSVSSFN